MKKNYTKSILLLVVSFVLSMGTIKVKAQVVSNESFDNTTFLPTGWASVGSTTLWSRRTTGTFPTCTPQSGAGMVRFSSRAQTAGTTQTIELPVIDYSAASCVGKKSRQSANISTLRSCSRERDRCNQAAACMRLGNGLYSLVIASEAEQRAKHSQIAHNTTRLP